MCAQLVCALLDRCRPVRQTIMSWRSSAGAASRACRTSGIPCWRRQIAAQSGADTSHIYPGGRLMRAYQDFREFLSVLEQERQLLRITEPVKFEPDLAA